MSLLKKVMCGIAFCSMVGVSYPKVPPRGKPYCNDSGNYCRINIHPAPGLETVLLKREWSVEDEPGYPRRELKGTPNSYTLYVKSSRGKKLLEHEIGILETVASAALWHAPSKPYGQIKVYYRIGENVFSEYCYYDKRAVTCQQFPERKTYCPKRGCEENVHPAKGLETVKLFTSAPKTDPDDPEGGYYVGEVFILKVTSQKGKTLLKKNFGNFGVADANFSSSLSVENSTRPPTIKATIITDYRGTSLGGGVDRTVFRCRYDRKWKCK